MSQLDFRTMMKGPGAEALGLGRMPADLHARPDFHVPELHLPDVRVLGVGAAGIGIAGLAAALLIPGGPGNPAQARGYSTGTMSIENTPVDQNGDGANDAIATDIELGDFRKSQGLDFVHYETRTSQNSGADTIVEGDVQEFFDSDPSSPAGAVVEPAYVGDPWTGRIRILRTGLTGQVPHFSELNGFDQNGNFTIRSLNNTFNLSPLVPPITQPIPTPPKACVLKPELAMTTAKFLPRNHKGKLSIITSVSSDSTIGINGKGKGNSLNIKVRNAAARIEVSFVKPTLVGKIANDSIAFNKGKVAKNGQRANLVIIDIPEGGVPQGNKIVDSVAYTAMGKVASFSARLLIPQFDCNTSPAQQAKALATAR